MSVSLIPEASKNATEEQTSIQKMLIENGRLIESIAEYQRLGRPAEAMKYQELLHKNLLYLGRLVDPQLAHQIQNIRSAPVVEPPSEASIPTSSATPQIQPQQLPTPPSNGTLHSPQQQMMNGSMINPAVSQPQFQQMNGPGIPPQTHQFPNQQILPMSQPMNFPPQQQQPHYHQPFPQ